LRQRYLNGARDHLLSRKYFNCLGKDAGPLAAPPKIVRAKPAHTAPPLDAKRQSACSDLEEMVRVVGLRWVIEQLSEGAKGEIGLEHSELLTI
jgi:hypothetical protein